MRLALDKMKLGHLRLLMGPFPLLRAYFFLFEGTCLIDVLCASCIGAEA